MVGRQLRLGAERLTSTEKGNALSPRQHLDCSLCDPEGKIRTPKTEIINVPTSGFT